MSNDIQVLYCEQGSEEWFAARRGIPTASIFQAILAGAEGRRKALYRLAGERLTGETAETYRNAAMERGKRMEPKIRREYEMLRGVEVEPVGFIRNGKAGASTDGLIGEHGAVEFKSAAADVMLEQLEMAKRHPDRIPPEHMAQCQGGLWITKRLWCDLMIYCPGIKPLIFRLLRNEEYIETLRRSIDVFDKELRHLVEAHREHASN